MTYDMNLNWHPFNVCVPEVQMAITPLVTSTLIVGISCNSALQIHFEAEPTQEEKEVVQLYWDSLTETSPEAVFYKTQSQINEEAGLAKESLLNSAKIKLQALGLTPEEVKATLGA